MSHAPSSDGGKSSWKSIGIIWALILVCALVIVLLLQYRAKMEPATSAKPLATVSDSGKAATKKLEEPKRPPLQKRNILDYLENAWEFIFPKSPYVPPDPNYVDPNFAGKPSPNDSTPQQPELQDRISDQQARTVVQEDTLFVVHSVTCPPDPHKEFSRRHLFYTPVLGRFKKWGKRSLFYEVRFRYEDGTEKQLEDSGIPYRTMLDVLYLRIQGHEEVQVIATLHKPKKGGLQ